MIKPLEYRHANLGSQLIVALFCQELENPVILIHEKKITGLQSILPVLELVVRVLRFDFTN